MSETRDPPVYSPLVVELFERPRRAGRLSGPDVLCGAAGSTERGVWVEFSVRIADGHIVDARFRAYGCPHTIAAAAWVAEHLVGRSQARAREFDPLELADRLEAPAEKLGNFLVVEDALKDCVAPRGVQGE